MIELHGIAILWIPVNHNWRKGRYSKISTACVCRSRLTVALGFGLWRMHCTRLSQLRTWLFKF